MAYKRKTRDEWEVQVNYFHGCGWECVYTSDRFKYARAVYKGYKNNQSLRKPHDLRIKSVRVPIENQGV